MLKLIEGKISQTCEVQRARNASKPDVCKAEIGDLADTSHSHVDGPIEG